MNIPFLRKYQPIFFKDFTIDKEYIELLTTLINMNNLNILLVGNNGCGKSSLLYATIIKEIKYQDKMYYISIILKNKVFNIIEQKLKLFVKHLL